MAINKPVANKASSSFTRADAWVNVSVQTSIGPIKVGAIALNPDSEKDSHKLLLASLDSDKTPTFVIELNDTRRPQDVSLELV